MPAAQPGMGEYKVQFEVFEGPLDLLLYLVKKEEVDIYEVNLTHLATQFIAYIELMRQLDLEVAGEFLLMASTLMYIKSRELLPTDQQVEAEGEEEEDPRWELIRQLVEYRKFKDAAAQLQSRELEQESTFPRLPARPDPVDPAAAPRAEASLFDLISAVGQVLKRVQEREGPREIYEDPWTVSQKIEHLRDLLQERPRLRFSELFAQTTTRSEVVATFLALLELIRLRAVTAVQSAAFGEIDLERLTSPPVLPQPAAEPSPQPEPGAATSA
jgi:segregation and condensation protein A